MTSKGKHSGVAVPSTDITDSTQREASRSTLSNEAGKILRTQAETIDRRETALLLEDIKALSSKETWKILHELRVHHIELEMQNEELRRAQVKLAEERARYVELYELAPVGYCTVSEQGLILVANLTAATLLGVPRNALGHHPLSRFILNEDQDIYYLLRRQLFKTGEPQTCELRMVREDETAFWAYLETTVAKDEGGQSVGRVVLSDITKRKQAEKRLRMSEERYRTLFQRHSAVKLVLDAESGSIIDANDAAAQFYGWSIEELKQMYIQEINTLAVEGIKTAMKQAASMESTRFEFRHKRADGSIRDVEVFSNSIEVAGMHLLHSIIHDITDRKIAEENNLEMERRFQQNQKLESLGALAGGMAHDFNNILSIILGHCKLIAEDIDAGMDPKTHVKLIEKAAKRAAELCMQMLTYSGKNTLIQTHINLWALVDETVKLLQPATNENVTFELDCNKKILEITGDKVQIQQVIMNLIINAAEAIGNQNGIIQIALKRITVPDDQIDVDFLGNAIQVGHYACLTVSDNGSGMNAKTQKRLFDPFYTTKFNGRGLGMSVILGIIKSHEGALQLSTTLGVGTTFKVYLPVSGKPAVFETSSAVDLFPAIKNSGTILLIDAETSSRIIGAALLKAMGFPAMIATNNHEALEIYRDHGSKIELILLSIIMPEMTGINLYRLLREISPALPIVISGCCAAENLPDEFNNDPYTATVQKPYKPGQLRDTFVKLLDKRM